MAGLGSWWGALVSAGSSVGSEALSLGSAVLHGAEYALPKVLHLAEKVAPSAVKITGAVLAYDMQKKVLQVQMARATAGQSPMNPAQQQAVAVEVAKARAREVAAAEKKVQQQAALAARRRRRLRQLRRLWRLGKRTRERSNVLRR